MKKYYLQIIVLFFLQTANSQEQHLIASTGGYLQNNTGSISFSVGEPAVQTEILTSFILTEGFQQPFITSLPDTRFLLFSARLVNRQTQILWKTTKDINTDYYEVQRSPDSLTFTKLFNVENNGSGAAINDYQVLDPLPLSGFDYYRLKNVEKDGNYMYSYIVSVYLSPGVVITVYPNPVVSILHINLFVSKISNISAGLYDVRGRLVQSKQIKVEPGENQYQWNISTLAPGEYFIRFTGLNIHSLGIVKQ